MRCPTQAPASDEHAGDLGDRLVYLDRAVGQGDLLGASRQSRHAGQRAGQPAPHPFGRFDGHHVEALRDESSGELAGAGSEVENRASAYREQLIDRDLGIARPTLVVLDRRRAEGTGLHRMLVVTGRRGHGLAPRVRVLT
jgi:hypothetical protein